MLGSQSQLLVALSTFPWGLIRLRHSGEKLVPQKLFPRGDIENSVLTQIVVGNDHPPTDRITQPDDYGFVFNRRLDGRDRCERAIIRKTSCSSEHV